MPPTDSNTPAPTPTPEQPKKPGFFARLFGKKEAPAAQPQRESQTPAPQLDEPTSTDGSAAPSEPADSSVSTPASTDVSEGVPTVSPDENPKPLDVPEDLQTEPVQADGETVSPTLPTQPPAPANESDESKDDSTTPPAPAQ